MADNFTEQFINGVLAGQQSLAQKQDTQYRRLRMQFEEEDRGIEKMLLQHRMKQLKIDERLQARQAAIQNLQTMSGQSQADIPEEALSPLSAREEVAGVEGQAFGEGPTPRNIAPMNIPGIEELNIPGISVRPQTLEQQLAQQIALFSAKEAAEIRPVARGGSLVRGGTEIFHNEYEDPADKVLVPVVNRDAQGRETTTYMKRSDIPEGFTSTRERLPQRPSTQIILPQEDLTAVAEAIKRGDQPADLTGFPGKERVKIAAMLAKEGFNTTRALQEQRALMTHYQTLNTGERANIRIAADSTSEAIDILEDAAAKWKENGFGTFSWAGIMAAKALGGDKAQLAKDVESAVTSVQENLAFLKSGASAPSVRVMDDAVRALNARQSPTDLTATIRRLRQQVATRRGAITSLEAITPTSQAGTADFDYDPATGTLKPAAR